MNKIKPHWLVAFIVLFLWSMTMELLAESEKIISSVLNDTGITHCSNGNNNKLDCPISKYVGQDAEHGINLISFTKVANGKCVKDNNTGLIWEVKQDNNNKIGNSLQDADDLYTWYEPDNSKNGGDSGFQRNNGSYLSNGTNGQKINSPASCYGYKEGDKDTYCNTHAYVQRVNVQKLCGYSNWRVPTHKELHSILDYSRTTYTVRKNGDGFEPAIDTDYFPHSKAACVWSASVFAQSTYGSSAWCINFTGGDSAYGKKQSLYMRLVHDEL